MTDGSYRQAHALALLLRDYGEADWTASNIGEDLDIDIFDENHQHLCRATITRGGKVRTAPVIGLGRTRHLGGDTAA